MIKKVQIQIHIKLKITKNKKIMKKTTIILGALFMMLNISVYSQGVVISDDGGGTADPHAVLDLQSSTKGFLLPRLTTPAMLTMTPPMGMMVILEGTGKIYMANTDLSWAPIVNETTLNINLLTDARSWGTSYYFGVNSGFLGDISEQTHTTAVGFYSGSNLGTGDYNTAIGSETGAVSGSPNLHHTTTLGFNARATANHQVVLGTLNETVIIPGSVRIHSQEDPPGINVGMGLIYVETVDSNLYYYNGDRWDQINPIKYQVGDIAMGGVIFYVDDTGQHGLIVSPSDAGGSIGLIWSQGPNYLTNAVGGGYYAGEMNTSLILANQASQSITGGAAKACIVYSSFITGPEYGDWYLPSVKELEEMYDNKDALNVVLLNINNGAGIKDLHYWSSEEYSTIVNNAYFLNMADGTWTYETKANLKQVRPVRRF